MNIIDQLPEEDRAQELIQLARKSDTGMQDLLDTYTILVHYNARVLRRGATVPLADLYQEGFIGLMRAVREFDGKYGAKFTTWAICCIKGALRNFLRSERKHSKNVSLSKLSSNNDRQEEVSEFIVNMDDEPIVEETLSTVARRFNMSKELTKRERDLVRIRYNLEV